MLAYYYDFKMLFISFSICVAFVFSICLLFCFEEKRIGVYQLYSTQVIQVNWEVFMRAVAYQN